MYPILVFDDSLRYVAQIDDYEYLAWTRRWRRPHSFEIHINRHKNAADVLRPGHFVVMKRGNHFRIGRVEYCELGLDQTGKLSEIWRIAGKNVAGMFEARIALHGTDTGSGYDVQSGDAETVMRHYVAVNCITPSDPNRIIPGLTLGTYYARGPTVQYRARFQTVADILEEISYVSGLGYEVRFDLDTKRFVFDVLQGRDLTSSQTENPPVTFSPEFGNVQMLGYRYSTLDTRNVAYVAGQGEAAERMVIEVSDGTPVGFDRREILIDARDQETAEQLQQRGREKLAEYGEETIMEVEYLPGGPFAYGVDFDLGDVVHVRYPGIAGMDARIVEVVEQIDASGDRLKITFGSEWPDLIRIISREQKELSVEVRR